MQYLISSFIIPEFDVKEFGDISARCFRTITVPLHGPSLLVVGEAILFLTTAHDSARYLCRDRRGKMIWGYIRCQVYIREDEIERRCM